MRPLSYSPDWQRATKRPRSERGWRILAVLLLVLPICGLAQERVGRLKLEHFDRDPAWEGFNNHVRPAKIPTIVQDFGYCPSPSAKDSGTIGGQLTRASKPAYYAREIGPLTLRDKLTASGNFRLTRTTGGSGIFFGWFNARQRGGSGRPVGSLGMDFDGEGKGARLAVRLISHSNKSCGTFITPFIPGKFRPTPIRNDGTVYRWELNYDPEANSGSGQFAFRIKSTSAKPEDFEGKWFTVNLPAGFKEDGASFDRFGLMNALKPGGHLDIFFSDLVINGESINLTSDPGWIGVGNRTNYPEANPAGAHDFGFSPNTSFAGGVPGEIGGKLWRSGDFAYYADRVGPLTLDQPLQASGKVVLLVGAPDSDMYLGWFNSSITNQMKSSPAADSVPSFVGVHIGGPTRVGHYFQPAYHLQKAAKGTAKTGPVLVPDHPFTWTLEYDPAAGQGSGAIRVTLGSESVSLPLPKGARESGIAFDRFGLFTSNIGGQMVQVYFDDFQYTATQ